MGNVRHNTHAAGMPAFERNVRRKRQLTVYLHMKLQCTKSDCAGRCSEVQRSKRCCLACLCVRGAIASLGETMLNDVANECAVFIRQRTDAAEPHDFIKLCFRPVSVGVHKVESLVFSFDLFFVGPQKMSNYLLFYNKRIRCGHLQYHSEKSHFSTERKPKSSDTTALRLKTLNDHNLL